MQSIHKEIMAYMGYSLVFDAAGHPPCRLNHANLAALSKAYIEFLGVYAVEPAQLREESGNLFRVNPHGSEELFGKITCGGKISAAGEADPQKVFEEAFKGAMDAFWASLTGRYDAASGDIDPVVYARFKVAAQDAAHDWVRTNDAIIKRQEPTLAQIAKRIGETSEYTAEVWHTGGGILCLRIVVTTGGFIFTAGKADGDWGVDVSTEEDHIESFDLPCDDQVPVDLAAAVIVGGIRSYLKLDTDTVVIEKKTNPPAPEGRPWALSFGKAYEIPPAIEHLVAEGVLLDTSSSGDKCPRFSASYARLELVLWVDHPEASERELDTLPRFALEVKLPDEVEGMMLYEGGNVAEVISLLDHVVQANR